MATYVALDPGAYHQRILALLPPASRPRGAGILDTVAFTLRRWFAWRLLAMVFIGIVTWAIGPLASFVSASRFARPGDRRRPLDAACGRAPHARARAPGDRAHELQPVRGEQQDAGRDRGGAGRPLPAHGHGARRRKRRRAARPRARAGGRRDAGAPGPPPGERGPRSRACARLPRRPSPRRATSRSGYGNGALARPRGQALRKTTQTSRGLPPIRLCARCGRGNVQSAEPRRRSGGASLRSLPDPDSRNPSRHPGGQKTCLTADSRCLRRSCPSS